LGGVDAWRSGGGGRAGSAARAAVSPQFLKNSHLDPTKHDPDIPLQTMVVRCCYDRTIRSPHCENPEVAGEGRGKECCLTRA
jgi:hypothetical protein